MGFINNHRDWTRIFKNRSTIVVVLSTLGLKSANYMVPNIKHFVLQFVFELGGA